MKNGESDPASIEKIVRMYKKQDSLTYDGAETNIRFNEDDFKCLSNAYKEYNPTHKDIDYKKLYDLHVIFENGNITFALSLFKDNCKNQCTLIRCRLYDGFDKSAVVLDKVEYLGNLIDGYKFMKSFINRNTKHGYKKAKNGGQIQLFSYPESSLDEVLINALAHRNYLIDGTQIDVDIYKDRLCITSPGECLLNKKPDEYNWENMISIRRNQKICDIFTFLGLMEQGGSGFKQIFNDYKYYFDEKKPEFEDYNDFFVVTLHDLLFKEDEIEAEYNYESKNIHLDYERLSGNREYDDVILNACYSEALTRAQIQTYTKYKSPNSVY